MDSINQNFKSKIIYSLNSSKSNLKSETFPLNLSKYCMPKAQLKLFYIKVKNHKINY